MEIIVFCVLIPVNSSGSYLTIFIGSSCIGASIVGGICNNSGGALVKRGPAYTELALYAQINAEGELVLVNELGIDLGNTPKEILTRLQDQDYSAGEVQFPNKLASDNEYDERVRDIEANTPSGFNADKRRLHGASCCAGKVAVFAGCGVNKSFVMT